MHFINFQILMSVLLTHVKMVVFALMESMDTHVTVLQDILDLTVSKVSQGFESCNVVLYEIGIVVFENG